MEKRKPEIRWVKVVVVGAGLAGLSAALKLHTSGVSGIAVLEAQAEPGGRVRSVPFSSGYAELGAQWLHGTENLLYELAEKNGLISEETSSEGLGNFYYDNGEMVRSEIVDEVKREVKEILTDLEQSYSDDLPNSVGEYLTRRFNLYLDSCDDPLNKKIKKDLFDWHLRFIKIDNSCSNLWKLSSKSFADYQYCGGQDLVNFKNSFQSVIDYLISELPDDCLFTNTPVKYIKWKEVSNSLCSNVCEIVTNKVTFIAEHVIVTCSVGYLKNNWSMFSPELPIKYIQGFSNIGFDTVNKIYLEYERNWWGNLEGIQLVWSSVEEKQRLKGRLEKWTCDISGFDPVTGLPNVLVGWVGGEGAIQMECLPSEVIGEHCTNLLRRITGDNNIPKPTRCISSSWHENKYIMGGYSHITEDKDRKTDLKILLEPVCTALPNNNSHPTIYFAGEALHSTYYSTTHGAFDSGFYQANKLIEHVSQSIV